MNWEAIAAIGQVVGALGVIVSLLYLASQVRHARRAVSSASADAALASGKDFIRMMIEDPGAARIFASGQDDPTNLSEPDRFRFIQMATFYLLISENIHYHWCEGTLAPRLWESMRLKLVSAIGQPGIRAVWKLRRDRYGVEFQTFVDTILTDAPVEGISAASRRLGESGAVARPAVPALSEAGEASARSR